MPFHWTHYGDRIATVFAHADDCALSAFAVCNSAGSKVIDILVCSSAPHDNKPSWWDRESGFNSASEAMSARLDEQNAFLKSQGLQGHDLGLLDKAYSPDPRQWAEAHALLASIVQAEQVDAIVTHSSHSLHKDHVETQRLAENVAAELDLLIINTCDRPYFSCDLHSHRDLGPTTCLSDAQWLAKQQALRLFDSQLTPLAKEFGSAWDSRAVLGAECYFPSDSTKGRN